MRLAIATLALLAAAPAAAQTADTDFAGHKYCNANGTDLRETGDGGYKVDLSIEYLGDTARTIYPAGGAKLFGPQGELKSYVAMNFEFLLGADGMPRGRPSPVRVAVSTGRFAGMRLEPLESLELKLAGGTTLSPPIAINSAYYNIAIVGGDLAPTGSDNPYDTEMKVTDFESLVQAFDNGERWILLFQNGAEVARIPVPRRDIIAERDQKIAWVRKTVPLLAQGKCG